MFAALSPGGAKGRLTVFIFHRVLPAADPLFPGEPDAKRFNVQMRWIRDWFNVLPLEEAVERLKRYALPPRAAAITFDDGYADNYTVALPILKQLRLPATFFIASGFLDGGIMWNDKVIESIRHTEAMELDLERLGLGRYPLATPNARRAAVEALLGRLKYLEPAHREDLATAIAETAAVRLPTDLMLSTEQLRGLVTAGMTVGAHTVNHPILAKLEESRAWAEMIESKERLEALTGQDVTLFAYPNGKPGKDYTLAHVGLARRAGFVAACSTGWGVASKDSDIFQLPRFTPWDRTPWRYSLRLAQNYRNAEQKAA